MPTQAPARAKTEYRTISAAMSGETWSRLRISTFPNRFFSASATFWRSESVTS